MESKRKVKQMGNCETKSAVVPILYTLEYKDTVHLADEYFTSWADFYDRLADLKHNDQMHLVKYVTPVGIHRFDSLINRIEFDNTV